MVNDLNIIRVRNGIPLLQRTYSIIPTKENSGDWKYYFTLLNKDDLQAGKIELPEDGERYEVFDSALQCTFIAEYAEYYKDFSERSGVVHNWSTWTTEVNGEPLKLHDVAKWRKIELKPIG